MIPLCQSGGGDSRVSELNWCAAVPTQIAKLCSYRMQSKLDIGFSVFETS
jgi:hypothetical protein